MQKCFLHFGVIALVMCAMLGGCKKADTTAASTDPQLVFTLVSDNPNFSFSSTAANKPTVVWTAGTVSVNRIQLNASHGGVVSSYATSALTDVDFFSPSTCNVSIPKGDYTLAKAAIFFVSTNTTDYPLTLKGNYTSAAGVVTPIEFDLNDNLEVDITVANIIADGTKNFNTAINMHLNMFLGSIQASDLDAATRTNGVIVLGKTTNTTLYTKMKTNMGGCGISVLTSTSK